MNQWCKNGEGSSAVGGSIVLYDFKEELGGECSALCGTCCFRRAVM